MKRSRSSSEEEATQEDLVAERERQSAVLSELLGGSGRGRGRGLAARGVGKGLVVARFNPAAQNTEEPEKKEPRAVRRASPQRTAVRAAEVNPTFARVFQGGPRRRESGLPTKEDEGHEGVSSVATVASTDAVGSDWLSSLGSAAAEDKPISASKPSSVDWLGTLTGGPARGQDSTPSTAVAVPASEDISQLEEAEWVGKALPIPPFWRMLPRGQLEQKLESERPVLAQMVRRRAKDSKRVERGRSGTRPLGKR
mmetsp:Transcript_58890/g.127370  ORF Transcript_58890/g.127370 Transcript_58890/m.127370 type:complete len:254 (-) Transcript_58890:43-804(-)